MQGGPHRARCYSDWPVCSGIPRAMESSTLYYVHDPMCSWCWGYRPVWDRLKQQRPSSLSIVHVLGGLAPDSDVPMPRPLQESIQGHWKTIAGKLGTEFNFDFWEKCQPRRSTYPSCRAVIAAEQQDAGERMIDAIQRAYYLRAMNPSDKNTLVALATELGLDAEQFAANLADPVTERKLQQHLQLRRNLGVRSFPSLVLEHSGQRFAVPLDYHSERPSLDFIDSVRSGN